MKKASVSATEYSSKIKEGTGSAQSYASAQKANNAALQSVGTGAGIASKAVLNAPYFLEDCLAVSYAWV